MLNFSVSDRFGAYIAYPSVTPAPVVVVVQEIFGVTEGIRGIADGLARDGYIAIAPDLFWRFSPCILLSEHSKEDWEQALGYYSRLDVEVAADDIEATIAVARALPAANGKVGVMGYCLGGLLSFIVATRGGVDAAVEYYGSQTERYLDRAEGIRSPLLIHLAGADAFMDEAAQKRIAGGLEGNRFVQTHVYEGRDHAFARPGGDHFHAGDAELANGRTRAFLRRHLLDR
ncbi:dienelactone hydrolase family protein [Luteibacter sp. CQ10]|uniref:dienelactone hydrolase family protein n=1 Tax=Luteibacter sp. CQ10 TaxID=2805821 RepID=UPI0034A4F94C